MKKNKFLAVLIIVLILSVASVLCLVGCKPEDPPTPPAHTHTFAETWSSDATYHWHAATCEHTIEVKDKAKHDWEQSTGKCKICDYACLHDYDEETGVCKICSFGCSHADCAETWTFDDVSHYHKCNTCGTKIDEAEHILVDGTCSVCGYNHPTEGLAYTSYGNCYMVGGLGNSTDTTVIIPNTYNGKPVVGVETYAFSECESIAKVIIEEGVANIQRYAFNRCRALETVVLPTTIEEIGAYAFYKCTSLKDVNLPEGLKEIYYASFYECALEAINIPESVEKIGEFAFGKTNIKGELLLPQGLTEIGNSAFSSCSNITKVVIPTSVKVLGSNAFYGCGSLDDITIQEGLEDLGNQAFAYTAETEVVIPNSVIDMSDPFYGAPIVRFTLGNGISNLKSVGINGSTLKYFNTGDAVDEIPEKKFYNCKKLEEVVLGAGVITISDEAFYNCSALAKVAWNCDYLKTIGEYAFANTLLDELTLPNRVNIIGENAFKSTSIASVSIPASVNSIAVSSFDECANLATINIDGANQTYSSQGNAIIDIANKTLLVGCKTTVIPDDGSVTKIGINAFSDVVNLTSINIPASITYIDERAFSSSGLTSVEIGANVSYIAEGAFYDCQSLLNIVVDAEEIESDAFADCDALTTATFGENVSTIGEGVFGSWGAWELTTLTINGGVISKRAFQHCSSLQTLVLNNGVESIGDYAFADCYMLASVTIPGSVKTIGAYAFADEDGYEDSSLTTVVFEDGIESIGESAFAEKLALTGTITIPASVKSIGADAFSRYAGGTGITGLVLNEGLETIGEGAFAGCAAITGEIVIPDSVTTIGGAVFWKCSGITSLVIGNSVEEIGYMAFDSMSEITTITIPASVTTIGDWILRDCAKLTEVIVDENNTVYRSENNCIILNETNEIKVACGTSTIPTGAEVIGKAAFAKGLMDTFIIPEGVTTIKTQAFEDCVNLTRIVIPDSVTVIEDDAFAGCTALASIEIGSGLATLGFGVFTGANIESITIDETNQTFVSISNAIVDKATRTLLVGCKNTVIPNDGSVMHIGKSAFEGIEDLESIVIPSKIVSIGANAFMNCKNLNSLTIEEGVKEIGRMVFYRCEKLTNVVIPESITSIGEIAFASCDALVSVQIGGGVLDRNVFEYCSALTTVVIGSNVEQIGWNIFTQCPLETVTFEDTEGWKAYDKDEDAFVNIDSTDLSDSATAIEYLQDTYRYNIWVNIF